MKERKRHYNPRVTKSGVRKAKPGHSEWIILGSNAPREGESRRWFLFGQAETKVAAIAWAGHMVYSDFVDAFAVVNLRNKQLECVFPLVEFPGKVRYGTVDMSLFPVRTDETHIHPEEKD